MKATITELVGLRKSVSILISLAILLSVAAIHSIPISAAFSPHQDDFFKYNETSNLGNGTGNYAGYTEHQTATGGENVTGVSGNTISMNYDYSYDWSNSSGSTLTGKRGGPYAFSESSFLYVSGSDNESSFGGAKYVNPTVWFAMNNSLPVGANFTVLATPIKIISENTNVFLPTQNQDVYGVIFAQGGGSYQRNDVYGQFSASYTWSAWYDQNTGYIVGYNYVEHDTNPNGDGFDYTDKLYVTSTSYPLTYGLPTIPISESTTNSTTSTIFSTFTTSTSTATIPTTSAPPTSSSTVISAETSSTQTPFLDYAIVIVAVVVALVVIVFLRRRDTSLSASATSSGTQT